MTVNFEQEIAAGRKATNDLGKRTYSRAFRLNTTDQSEGPYAVGSHPSLPIIGSAHPEEAAAKCIALNVENTDPWKGWTVTADYSTQIEYATDPTSDPAIITLQTEQFQKPAVFDLDGYGIVNSAGDPYDPPNMMDDSRRIFQVQKNMASVPSWVISSQDCTNSDVFSLAGLSIAVGTAKVQSVSIGEQQTRNGVTFRVLTLQIQVQRDGWILKPLDAGFRQLAWDGATRINIYNPASTGDANGGDERPTAPVPLNGSGQAQSNPTITSAVFGSHTVYQTMAFATLPLT